MTYYGLHRICPKQLGGTPRRWTNRWSDRLIFIMALTLLVVPMVSTVVSAETITPFQRAVITPKGMLKNPYQNNTIVAKKGLEIYRALDCSGCHGGGGGGGMAAPLRQPRLDLRERTTTTLFRVIALGTGSLSPGDAFRKQGYRRQGSEFVEGPMPPYGEIIKSDNDIWKIISWLRSIN